MNNYYQGNSAQFQDQFVKLFPELQNEVDKYIGDKQGDKKELMVKNITFVTTEACNLNCTYCFAANTPILMSDFTTKPIKDIKTGDKILGFKEFPKNFIGSKDYRETVVKKIYKRTTMVTSLKFSNGTVLTTTPDHPFLVFRRNRYCYIEVKSLVPGEILVAFNPETKTLEEVRLTGIYPGNKMDVYNFGTGTNTYFAGGIAVHNCYESHKTPKKMSVEVAKKAIDTLFDKEKMNGYLDDRKHKAVIIEFIGGEPFLNIEVMEFVADYFLYKATNLNHPWANHFMFSVTTNGTLLLDDPRVKHWIDKYKNRLSIGITIDGDKELHDACRVFHDGRGSYDTVVKSVKYAIKNFGMYNTKVTFAHENLDKINTAIPHLFDLGLTDIHANCVYEDVWKEGDDKIFYNQLKALTDYMLDKKLYEDHYCSIFDNNIGHPLEPSDNSNWCGGDGSMLAISVDGRFFPCIRYMKYAMTGEVKREEMIIGDVDRGVESKNENKYLISLSNITRKSQSTEECFNCKVGQGCSWCTAFNYLTFGTPNKRATFICKMHKARVAANCYYWNSLYRKLGMSDRFKLYLTKDECLKFMSEDEYTNLCKLQEEN